MFALAIAVAYFFCVKCGKRYNVKRDPQGNAQGILIHQHGIGSFKNPKFLSHKTKRCAEARGANKGDEVFERQIDEISVLVQNIQQCRVCAHVDKQCNTI